MSEQYTAAARWWADCLRGPAMQDIGWNDGGLRLLAAASRAPITDEQISAFEHELLGILEDELSRNSEMTISVDYEPCGYLDAAAHWAGFDADLRFPAKTVMWIDASAVRVRCGYGAQAQTIWTKGGDHT